MRKFINALVEWKPLLPILLVINFLGTIYGFWWYRGQFAETPLYLWPFVPNSPLSVLYILIALLFFKNKKRSPFWEAMAYFGLIKHGLWTVAIITVYHFTGRAYPENFLLWTGHLGMALQAVLFWAYYGLPLSYPLAAGISLWYFFNDYLDYVVGIHPRVDTGAISVAAIRGLALTYSVVLALTYLYTAWRHHSRRDRNERKNA